MIFSSPEGFLFCLLFLVLFYTVKTVFDPKILLVVSNLLFYYIIAGNYCLLLIFTSYFDHFLAGKIDLRQNSTSSKLLLTLSLFVNFGILFTLKYYNFFIDSIAFLLPKSTQFALLQVYLPPGISFYTFQSSGYMIDVYRGKQKVATQFVDYFSYLSFFPQLVAGPIVAAKDLLPQLQKHFEYKISSSMILKGLVLVLIGFIKKSVFADTLSLISDSTFNPSLTANFSSFSLYLGVLAYSLQIYFDFSGYSDMAIGIACLFGIQLPENFNFPYMAFSFSDFWKRWHMTLSTWLREYLYIPLGGNRSGNFRTYWNLLVTMLLGGLWHGASWNFVVWGILHGFYLSIERVAETLLGRKISDIRPLLLFLYRMILLFLIAIAWIFFRAKNFESAVNYIKGLFLFRQGMEIPNSMQTNLFLIFMITLFCMIYFHKKDFLESISRIHSRFLFPFYAFLLVIAILLSSEGKPFIYFVF